MGTSVHRPQGLIVVGIGGKSSRGLTLRALSLTFLSFFSQLVSVSVIVVLRNLGPKTRIFKTRHPPSSRLFPSIGAALSLRLLLETKETLEGPPIMVHPHGISSFANATGWEGRVSNPALPHHVHHEVEMDAPILVQDYSNGPSHLDFPVLP